MSDLASFDAFARVQDEGVPVVIKDPKGQSIGLTIRVASYESERAKAYQRKALNDAIGNPRTTPLSAEERDANTLRFQMHVITGWEFAEGLKLDGEVPAFTPENVEKLLTRFRFIAAQIDAAAADQARFFQASSNS